MKATPRPLCPLTHGTDPDGNERHRQAADGIVLCDWHHRWLRRHIAGLPALDDALVHALAGGSGGIGVVVSYRPEPGISLDPRAVLAREHLRVQLVGWARVCIEEGPWSDVPDDTVPAIARWLLPRSDWLAARPYADEVAATFATTWSESWRVAYPDGARRYPVGECPERGCDGILVAVVRDADELLPSTLRCTAGDDDERHEWPADQWPALGRRLKRTGWARLAGRVASLTGA